MNIAILGYGIVGSGAKKTIDHAVTKSIKQLHVSYILTHEGKAKILSYMCDDIQTILQDTSVDVIVEAIGGLELTHTYILQALKSGKHVVTANKAAIAAYLKEFTDATREHNVRTCYEASTGGRIPWIEGLVKTMRIDEADRIHGTSNSTSNYILDHMQYYHVFFEDILEEAQELGYTEANSSADIDDYDIYNKLRISASLAYDYHVPDTFPAFGICNIMKQDVSYSSPLSYAVCLIAKTRRNANRYGRVVEPVLSEAGSLESNTQDNYNLITLHGKTTGDLKFFGQGAGKFPTVNAIVQGPIDLEEGVCYMDPLFANVMSYDEILCLRDHILHVNEATCNELQDFSYGVGTLEGQEYLHIQKAEVYEMYQAMERTLKTDVHASMASIYEKEDDQQYGENNKVWRFVGCECTTVPQGGTHH